MPDTIDGNIAYVSQVAAQSVRAKVLIIHTTTGSTARRVACHRPKLPVLALSSEEKPRRLLALTWGIESALVDVIRNTRHMVFISFHQAIQCGYAAPGDIMVVTAGTPYGTAGRTNMLKIEEVREVSPEEFEQLADD